MQKTMIDGRWIDRIGVNETDVSEAGFKKMEELTKIVRNQEFLAFPLFNRDGELIAGIQVEAKRKKVNNAPMGFFLIDDLILKTVTSCL